MRSVIVPGADISLDGIFAVAQNNHSNLFEARPASKSDDTDVALWSDNLALCEDVSAWMNRTEASGVTSAKCPFTGITVEFEREPV